MMNLPDRQDMNALERRADQILRETTVPSDAVLSAAQMKRRHRRESVSVDNVLEPPSKPEVVADLRFIGSLSPLSEYQRQVYTLWIDGYAVQEIAHVLGFSAPTACRILRSALLRCWLMGPEPFGAFIRRSIYRPPAKPHGGYRSGLRCVVCAAPLWDDGDARLCDSEACRTTVRRQRALDRRRMARR